MSPDIGGWSRQIWKDEHLMCCLFQHWVIVSCFVVLTCQVEVVVEEDSHVLWYSRVRWRWFLRRTLMFCGTRVASRGGCWRGLSCFVVPVLTWQVEVVVEEDPRVLWYSRVRWRWSLRRTLMFCGTHVSGESWLLRRTLMFCGTNVSGGGGCWGGPSCFVVLTCQVEVVVEEDSHVLWYSCVWWKLVVEEDSHVLWY